MIENSKPDWEGAKTVRDAKGIKWHLLSDGTYRWGVRGGVFSAAKLEAWFGPCVVVEDGRIEKGK